VLIVYTAAIGDTDAVQAPELVVPGVRYLCFSDRPCPAPYEWIRVERTSDPALASRVVKVLATDPALQGASITLWHDAVYRLMGPLDWVPQMLEQSELIGLAHHRHRRIEDEAIAVADRGFVGVRRAWKLVCQYRDRGFAGEQAVTMGGLLARRICPKVQQFNAIWWHELQRWNGRDQASLDYAAWAAGLSIRHLSGWMRENPYAEWRREVAA
jgi:hypothetical protein